MAGSKDTKNKHGLSKTKEGEDDDSGGARRNTEKCSAQKKTGKNVHKSQGVPSQIPATEFRSFTQMFFAEIDSSLFNFATRRCREERKHGAQRPRRQRLKTLERKIENAVIFTGNGDDMSLGNKISQAEVKSISEEVFATVMECKSTKSDVFSAPWGVESMLEQQIAVNNRNKDALKGALKERIRSHAYFYALRVLESDLETVLVTKLRNKKFRKNQEPDDEDLDVLIKRIEDFKKEYGDACNYPSEFADFADTLDSSNADLAKLGLATDPYFPH